MNRKAGAAHHRGPRRKRYEVSVTKETHAALEMIGRLLHKSPGQVIAKFVLGQLE